MVVQEVSWWRYQDMHKVLLARLFLLLFVSLGLTVAHGQSTSAAGLEVVGSAAACERAGPFVATVSWQLPASKKDAVIEIRVDKRDGNLLTRRRGEGEANTGQWANRNMRFFLVDPSADVVLAEAGVTLPDCDASGQSGSEPENSGQDKGVESPATESSTGNTPANPDRNMPSLGSDSSVEFRFVPPYLRYCGTPVERIAVEVFWDATDIDVTRMHVLIDGPDGTLFTQGSAKGSKKTGKWVTNGKRFLLYSPERDQVIAEKSFQLLPCNTVKYPLQPD